MALNPVSASRDRLSLLVQPWSLVLVGLGASILGLLLLTVPTLTPARVIVTGVGVLVAGVGVARRLTAADEDLDERVVSAGLVAVSSLTALIAFLALKQWDSARLFFGALFGVGLGGSLLVLLPSLGRRIVLSVLVLLHFGCILTAVTLVPPPGGHAAPWLSMQLYARVYRPYMSFMYLTNAYHFYSPDPGPANLLWFYVELSDGSTTWIRLPYRSDYKINIQYQRMLALTEFASNRGPVPLSDVQVPVYEKRMHQPYNHDTWETILGRRQRIAQDIPELQMVADILPNVQYSEPSDDSKHFLSAYAQHVAATTSPPAGHPDATVKSVRIYRVMHTILSPRELAEGHSPDEPVYYWPFYMGKFDPVGKLLDPHDPCLYWLLPRTYVTPDYPSDKSLLRLANPPNTNRLIDCVEIHARLRTPEE